MPEAQQEDEIEPIPFPPKTWCLPFQRKSQFAESDRGPLPNGLQGDACQTLNPPVTKHLEGVHFQDKELVD